MQILARTRIEQYIEWIFGAYFFRFFKAHGKKILANAVKTRAGWQTTCWKSKR